MRTFFFFFGVTHFPLFVSSAGESGNMYKLKAKLCMYVHSSAKRFFSLGGKKKEGSLYVMSSYIHRGFSAPQKRKKERKKKESDLPFDKGDLLGSAYAPLVGGALTDRVTWRWWHVRFFYHFMVFFFWSLRVTMYVL